MKIPKTMNRVEHQWIDATPKGYALRILKHYRAMCNMRYENSGVTRDGARTWEVMNKIQVERAKELDRAINTLTGVSFDLPEDYYENDAYLTEREQ